VAHRQHRDLTNRAEHAHQPTRPRERRMPGLQASGHAHRFLAAYGPLVQHFRPRRHRLSAPAYRQERHDRCQVWAEMTGTERAAEGASRSAARPISSFYCLETRSLRISCQCPHRST
jgi:putative transposase